MLCSSSLYSSFSLSVLLGLGAVALTLFLLEPGKPSCRITITGHTTVIENCADLAHIPEIIKSFSWTHSDDLCHP
uniref:Movement protein TGBp3 n=1 Tax=White ash mosaic virus TaxID=375547 RepID=D7PQV0_9VIRU|nr:8 kDa protein [White ash mosaic virus]